MKLLSFLSLLCLLYVSDYPRPVGAGGLSKRGALKSFSKARVRPSKPSNSTEQVTRSLLSPLNLFSRRDVCPPGTLPCLINDKCCPGECCLDDTCCDIVQDCYNDLSDSVGPSYCCERYTEADCDGGGCMPFQANCCGNGKYCEWDHYCTDTGCCPEGELCSSSPGGDIDDDDDDDGNGGSDDHNDHEDNDAEPAPTKPSPEPTPAETTSSSSTSSSTSKSSSRSTSRSTSSSTSTSSTSSESSSTSRSGITDLPSIPPGGSGGDSNGDGGSNVSLNGAVGVRMPNWSRVITLAVVVGVAAATC